MLGNIGSRSWQYGSSIVRSIKKKTEDQYSPVRLEQARLDSSLLYGTRLMLYFSFKRHFRSVEFKELLRVVTRATQKEQATTSLKSNLLNIRTSIYQRNLRLSFLVWEPKSGGNIRHTVLSSTTGLDSPKSLASDRASSDMFLSIG